MRVLVGYWLCILWSRKGRIKWEMFLLGVATKKETEWRRIVSLWTPEIGNGIKFNSYIIISQFSTLYVCNYYSQEILSETYLHCPFSFGVIGPFQNLNNFNFKGAESFCNALRPRATQ
jgi:hypothetical protein